MRYLAIDYGLKRSGLAICDPGETIISPLCRLDAVRSGQRRLIEQIVEIIDQNQVNAIVVGLPLNMDGSEGRQAQIVRRFAVELGKSVAIAVYFQDERLSTAAADEIMAEAGLSKKKQKEKRDMLAACEILRDYIDGSEKLEK